MLSTVIGQGVKGQGSQRNFWCIEKKEKESSTVFIKVGYSDNRFTSGDLKRKTLNGQIPYTVNSMANTISGAYHGLGGGGYPTFVDVY